MLVQLIRPSVRDKKSFCETDSRHVNYSLTENAWPPTPRSSRSSESMVNWIRH